jgi:hypothetical protein
VANGRLSIDIKQIEIEADEEQLDFRTTWS